MMKAVIPVIASLALTSLAVAQESTQPTPRTERAPRAEARVRAMGCRGGSFLGVYLADVTEENASSLGVTERSGALIMETVKESAAEKAGLQKNDVVISWNGTPVESMAQFQQLVAKTPAGETVRIGYIRSGARNEVEATLGSRPGAMAFQFNSDTTMVIQKFIDKEFLKDLPQLKDLPMMSKEEVEAMTREFNSEKMEGWTRRMEEWAAKLEDGARQFDVFISMGDSRTGAMLQSMTPQLAKYFGVNEGSGALVGSVNENSPSAAAGLQAGDVIIEVAGEKVESPKDVHRVLSGKGEEEVEVKAIRDRQVQTFRIKLSAPAMNDNFRHQIFEQFGNGSHHRIIIPFDGQLRREFRQFQGDGEEEIEIEINPTPSENGSMNNGEMELGDVIVPREPLQETAPLVATPLPSSEVAPPPQPVDL